MCISLNPAEFKGTVIANFPQNTDNEQERVLSYMNSVLSSGTPAVGMASAPNAMVFPVYGEVTGVLDCENPAASRGWLGKQEGAYYESWQDESALRGGSGQKGVEVAGNYLVSIASDIKDIPDALRRLRREAASGFPSHVPEVSDYALQSMDRFYRAQGLGIPQFVLAAFALPPRYIDHKNPVTITYKQFDSVADKIIFPALDYHGEGEFPAYVKRDHTLLFSTNKLNAMLGSVMQASAAPVPSEFNNAPRQFPMSVRDLRNPKNKLDARAPNNDYMFDMAAIHSKLQGVQTEIDALSTINALDAQDNYRRQQQVIKIMVRHLGRYGVMAHSNQPATTAKGFVESGLGDVLGIGGFFQEDFED